MSENTDDISVLFPDRVIEAKGEKIVVRPFYFGELPVVVKLLYPILSAHGLSNMIIVKKNAAGKFDLGLRIPENLIEVLMASLVDASEPVIELLMFSFGKDRAWFNTLDPDVGVELTLKWFEVNQSFFVQRVLPRIQHLIPKAPEEEKKTENASDGSTSLPSSNEEVILEAKSTDTP